MDKMNTPHDYQYLIPGIKSTFFKRKFWPDFIFFLAVVALPSSFFALVPKEFFYDVRLVYWMVGMFYGMLYFKNIKKIARLPGGKLLILLVVFLIFKFFHSLLINAIPLREVITIFRTNFFYPIVALGFLLYAAGMDNKRINRFLHWILLATLIQGGLYIFSNLTGINVFAVVSKEFQEFQGVTLMQNMAAIPGYGVVVFTMGLVTVSVFKKNQFHLLWLIPLIVTLLSIVRSQIIVFSLIVILCILGGQCFFKQFKLKRILTILVLILCSVAILSMSFPSHVGRVLNKFGYDQGTLIGIGSNLEMGTYSLRLNLIGEAYNRTKMKGNLILGNGYVRESTRGEYDFVVGNDSLIAPVIFTEGIVGLLFRIFPVLFFLCFGLTQIIKRKSQYSLVALIMVIIIIPEILNGVQTRIFVYYTEILFVFYLMVMMYYNQNKEPRKLKVLNNVY